MIAATSTGVGMKKGRGARRRRGGAGHGRARTEYLEADEDHGLREPEVRKILMARLRIDVADSADGLDAAVAVGAAAQFAPYLPDVNVDAPVERIEGAAEHALADVVARDDAPRGSASSICSRSNSTVVRSMAASFLDTVRVAGSSVTSPTVTTRQHVLLARLDAAEHGMDARRQLARVEGLGQIVVGANLQADDAIDVFAAGSQQDDRNRRSGVAARGESRSRSARAA